MHERTHTVPVERRLRSLISDIECGMGGTVSAALRPLIKAYAKASIQIEDADDDEDPAKLMGQQLRHARSLGIVTADAEPRKRGRKANGHAISHDNDDPFEAMRAYIT